MNRNISGSVLIFFQTLKNMKLNFREFDEISYIVFNKTCIEIIENANQNARRINKEIEE